MPGRRATPSRRGSPTRPVRSAARNAGPTRSARRSAPASPAFNPSCREPPQKAISAIDRLFENSGAHALENGTPIQRFWRDAHAGRVHAANDPERALQMFGAHEFGHKIDPGMY